MHLLLSVIWFFTPAGVANMAPIVFNRLPILDVPVDFGKKIGGKPIFGPHKTYRGFVVGVGLAIAIVYLQKALYPHFKSYSLVDYTAINLVGLGMLQGVGALGGDLIKSFFKRRFNIASGKSWVPFDQLDAIVGALILTSFMVSLTPKQVLVALIAFGLLHPVANLLGYVLGFKRTKF